MKALIQRVTRASVNIDERCYSKIGAGLLVFLGIDAADTPQLADRLLERLLAYRVFSDIDGRMNLSLQDTAGDLLIVSQFTLSADTRKGLRPGFSTAASPALGKHLYDYFVARARQLYPQVATGCFGADMQVSLVNDGPVTFLLEVH